MAELHAAALALRGEHSAAGDGRSLTIDSRELDTAAARPEFDVPLAALAEAISTRQLEVTGPEFTRGRASVEDAAMWAEAELDVVLSHPALRAAVPTSRLARAIQTRCASACDAGLLRLFAKLFSQPDEFTRALAQGLLNDGLGATIGSALRLTDDAVAPELCALWKVCPSLGTTLLPRLLARAEKEPAVVALLTQLIEGLDRPTVLAAVALEGLGTAEARALLAGTQPAGPALRTFLEALAPPVAAELLATLPASSWNAMSAVSLKLMKSGAPLVATRLMGRALEEEQALKPFIPALLESHARGLDEAMVKRLAARLLSERAEHVVVGLALTRAVTERTRLTCLEALSSRPALTAEVSRFRVAELFDPPAVRDRLRIMRRLSRRRLTLDKSRP